MLANQSIKRLASGVAVLPLIAAAGCSTATKPADAKGDPTMTATAASAPIPGIVRASSALQGLRELRDQLIVQKTQVDKTLAAMGGVVNGQGDLVPAFQTFTVSVGDTKMASDRVQTRTDAMRADARDYITGWEVEVYGVDDPDLRRQAESRRTQVRNNYAKINDALKMTRVAYDKYNTALTDLQRYLSNDLTKGGVTAAASSASKATDAGNDLKTKIDGSVAELDRVAGEMTPAGPAKAVSMAR